MAVTCLRIVAVLALIVASVVVALLAEFPNEAGRFKNSLLDTLNHHDVGQVQEQEQEGSAWTPPKSEPESLEALTKKLMTPREFAIEPIQVENQNSPVGQLGPRQFLHLHHMKVSKRTGNGNMSS